MWMLLVAIVLLGLKLAELGPFADLSWWWIALLLGLAFVWWEVIDPMFALSQKRAMKQMDQRREARADRARKSLGMRPRK
jgi:small Trp-rich protein